MAKKHVYSRRKKKTNRSFVITIVILLIAISVSVAALLIPWQVEPTQAATSLQYEDTSSGLIAGNQPDSGLVVSSAPAEPETLTVKFSAVGDNLIHNGIFLQANARMGGAGYDFAYAYEHLSYFYEDYDVNWINQETLITNDYTPSGYPTFASPGELGNALYDAGWRVFALSNNHSYDKLSGGISSTLRYWESMPDDVVYYGLYTEDEDESAIALQEVNGLTIAYVAYTEHTNMIPTPADAEAHVIYTDNLTAMEWQVRRAREMADAVVVSVHWGVENSHNVVQAQRDLAASFAEWGADVVIGTHPHVMQEAEWIHSADGRDVLVAYSLGNFISAQEPSQNLVGLTLTFEITQQVDADGTRHPVQIQSPAIYPNVTYYEAGYNNIHNYMLRDYTDEIAAGHARSNLTPQYVRDLASQYISEEFLILD